MQIKRFITILALFFFAIMIMPQATYGLARIVVNQKYDLVKVFEAGNTEYIIKDNLDLGGKTVKIGKGCVITFKGGSLANGTIIGNNTRVKSSNYEIFKRGAIRYRAYKKAGTSNNMPPSITKKYHNCIVIEGKWCNKSCGTNWTGLLNGSNEDVMLAVKNYIMLHCDGSKVKLPTINVVGYETTTLPNNRFIDFNHSTISYPDNLGIWEDSKITIPTGTTPCNLETGYGFVTINSNTTIANLSLNGKSSKRPNEPLRLGVSCLICINNAKNVKLDNIALSNTLGSGIIVHAKSKDISFKNCRFNNIEEHVIYSHQYLGYCHFENCTFNTWDSERLSVFRNGQNYLYKHAPLSGAGDISYDELYNFDLSFTGCTFNNPKRVNAQGRTLGGFLTGDFPVIIKLTNCKFMGAPIMLNPTGGATISEKSGKTFRMIVCGCDGAPFAYASKANYNIITEFYNCTNIPFRVVYAKRYERCKLYFDLYEDNIENVSNSFKEEFAEPLVVKDCEFIDRGNDVTIHHPLLHRPVLFTNCRFVSDTKREKTMNLLTVKTNSLSKVEFRACKFDVSGFRLIGDKNKIVHFNVKKCDFKSIQE